jgi:hypothetical protein
VVPAPVAVAATKVAVVLRTLVTVAAPDAVNSAVDRTPEARAEAEATPAVAVGEVEAIEPPVEPPAETVATPAAVPAAKEEVADSDAEAEATPAVAVGEVEAIEPAPPTEVIATLSR